jgi:hypothetical protein
MRYGVGQGEKEEEKKKERKEVSEIHRDTMQFQYFAMES